MRLVVSLFQAVSMMTGIGAVEGSLAENLTHGKAVQFRQHQIQYDQIGQDGAGPVKASGPVVAVITA